MKTWLTPLLLGLGMAGVSASATAAGESCDVLRSRIESKISAAGVTNFKLLIVEAGSPARGQVVGSCELGTKQIVYQRDSIPVPREERIVTECRDGSVGIGGRCKP